MAVVGEAYIVVRAITNQVKDDIRRGFDGAYDEGRRAGERSGKGYKDGFGKNTKNSRMFSNLTREALQAGEAFNRLVTVGYALGPAIAGLVGIIGGAASGLFALGAQAAAAVPAVFALVNALSALAQAGAVLKVVFAGVGAAIGAGLRGSSGGGGGGGGIDLSRQIEQAKERIEDARKALAKAYQTNAEALKRANQAIEDAKEREAEAYENVNEAVKGVTEAEEDLAKATENVNKAREEAREQIQQLRFELEESVLSEERAVLSYEKAREKFAKVQNLPPNNRARREAELEFKEADLRLRRAKDRTSDLTKEEADATKKGVEGSELVIAAKEREAEAEENLEKAKKNVVDLQKELARATREVDEADAALNATLAENKTRLEDARDALQDAKDALEDLKKAGGGGGGGGGLDAFAEAMAKLSPKAREFVRLILDIVEAFKPIKLAAQDAFFGKFNDGVRLLADTYLPILEKKLPKTAGLLGQIGKAILETLSSTENVERITNIWDSNDKVIARFGMAINNLIDVLLILMNAAAPLAEDFAKWIMTLTGGWKETLKVKEGTGELADTFAYAGEVAATLGGIFGNIFRAIMNIGKAAAGPGSGGEMLLNMLKEVTQKWEDFTGSEEGQARLTKFFQNIVPLVSELGGLVADVFKAIFQTTESGAEGEDGGPLAGFVSSLREVVAIFADMGPTLMAVLPTIGEGFVSAAEAISNLTSGGALQAFFDTLKTAADVAKDITGSPLFQKIFAVVAPIFAISRGLSLVFKFAKFLFLGSIVANIVKFAGFFKTLANVVKIVVFNFRLLGFALGIGTGPLALIVAGIAAAVAVFILMWQNSEKLRNAIKELIDKVIAKAVEVFNNLKQKLEDALEPFGGIEGAGKKLGEVFGFLGDIVATYIVPLFEYGLMNAFAIVEAVIGTLIDWIGNFIKAWEKIWTGISTGDIGMIFEGVVDAITAPFRAIWDNLSKLFSDIFNNLVNLVKSLLGIASPSKVFTDIATAIVEGFINVMTFLPRKFFEIWLSAVTTVLDFLTNTLGPALMELPGKIAEWISGLWDAFWEFLVDIFSNIWDFFGPGGELAKEIAKLLVNIGKWLKGVWDAFFDFLVDIGKKIFEFLGPGGDLFQAITDLDSNIVEWLTGIWDAFFEFLKDIFKKVFEFFGPGGTLNTKLKELVKSVGTWLKGVWDKFFEFLEDTAKKVWSFFGPGGTLSKEIAKLIVNVAKWLKGVWDGLFDALNGPNGIWTKITGFFGPGGTVQTWLQGLPGKIASWVSGMWDGIYDNIVSVWEKIKGWWNRTVAGDKIFGGQTVDLPPPFPGSVTLPRFTITIPSFAKGGIVPATPGGMMAIIGEAGKSERVEPLDENGLSKRDKAMIDYLTGGAGGNTTINVYPSPGMDERELAQKVSRELAFMMRRGSV